MIGLKVVQENFQNRILWFGGIWVHSRFSAGEMCGHLCMYLCLCVCLYIRVCLCVLMYVLPGDYSIFCNRLLFHYSLLPLPPYSLQGKNTELRKFLGFFFEQNIKYSLCKMVWVKEYSSRFCLYKLWGLSLFLTFELRAAITMPVLYRKWGGF